MNRDKDLWKQGCIAVPQEDKTYRAVRFWVKQYEKPSEYGIYGYGRISKLCLTMDGKTVANFDRGNWEVYPTCRDAIFACQILIYEYN